MDSVSAQDFGAWEHLIVDDGSDDGTEQEVTSRVLAEPRIRYLRRRGGIGGANTCRNIGITESRADLVVLLDSDDLLRPRCLERRVQVMHENLSLDFAVFRAGVFVNSRGDLTRLYHSQNPGDDLLRFLALECPWQTSGPIWRRDFLLKIGCFDETLLSMQDLELHVRALSARAKYICFLDVDHDIRGQEDPNKTSVRHFKDPAYICGTERVGDKLLSAVKTSGALTWSRQRALLGLGFGAAESWVRLHRLYQAMRTWNRACIQLQSPMRIRAAGLLMLCATRFGTGRDGVCLRLVNKWKGWVRFRQEPLLLECIQS